MVCFHYFCFVLLFFDCLLQVAVKITNQNFLTMVWICGAASIQTVGFQGKVDKGESLINWNLHGYQIAHDLSTDLLCYGCRLVCVQIFPNDHMLLL